MKRKRQRKRHEKKKTEKKTLRGKDMDRRADSNAFVSVRRWVIDN